METFFLIVVTFFIGALVGGHFGFVKGVRMGSANMMEKAQALIASSLLQHALGWKDRMADAVKQRDKYERMAKRYYKDAQELQRLVATWKAKAKKISATLADAEARLWGLDNSIKQQVEAKVEFAAARVEKNYRDLGEFLKTKLSPTPISTTSATKPVSDISSVPDFDDDYAAIAKSLEDDDFQTPASVKSASTAEMPRKK